MNVAQAQKTRSIAMRRHAPELWLHLSITFDRVVYFCLVFYLKSCKKEMTHENSIGFGVEWCACDTAHMRFANKYPIQTPIIYL